MKTIAALLTLGAPAFAATPAFPGATGAGMFATGGRGGAVMHVTNLNASGPGSFAEAVSQGNCIVVFDVSGIIDLTERRNGTLKGGRVDIDRPNVTVAGQTAPGEGICFKGGVFHVSADNVILRHIRSRRGFVADEDTGDAIEVKPESLGEAAEPGGQTEEAFQKRKDKKLERGKIIHDFAPLKNIVIDHCSTSWATDENLTVTHTDHTTIAWSIAAEGCDYPNPKQTPPNHSEGSLWGSEAPDGRATMHHVLYAHNRLRNPRTTGGDDPPPVLTFYNNVVYDWLEYASHTGSERVLLNWVNNRYKAGPSTPTEIRGHMFEFHGDPGARIFAHGNWIDGMPEATRDNKLAVFHGSKFRKRSDKEKAAMKVDQPFGDLPAGLETAGRAYERVLTEAGATLPARDSVDLRIVNAVRSGQGRVIGKETDLPEEDRWPDYRSLPPPPDADRDGMPDFWEKQFGLNPAGADDAAHGAHGGYTNIEHYLNNTDPAGAETPIVFVAATVSRARLSRGQIGEWQITRTGSAAEPLTVSLTLSGDAAPGQDYKPLPPTLTLPAGAASANVRLESLPSARDNRTVSLSLSSGPPDLRIGCPATSLIVIRR